MGKNDGGRFIMSEYIKIKEEIKIPLDFLAFTLNVGTEKLINEILEAYIRNNNYLINDYLNYCKSFDGGEKHKEKIIKIEEYYKG